MARYSINLKKGQVKTTPALANRADWVNCTNTPCNYCIFQDGETEDEWPMKEGNTEYIGLPWAPHEVIATSPSERLLIISRVSNGNVEGHEAAA